jgi:hypothetical protein
VDLTSSARDTRAAVRSVPAPRPRTVPTAYRTWEAHQREKRLDRYTHAWVAVIGVVTVATVGLAWLWLWVRA